MTAPATSTDRSRTPAPSSASNSSSACYCPELPEVIEPITGEIKCRCCGQPLVLTCPGECGEEHVRESMAAARRQLRAGVPALRVPPPRGSERRQPLQDGAKLAKRKETKPRNYKDKPCKGDGCGRVFSPSGPRDDFCLSCRNSGNLPAPTQKTRVA